LYLAINGNAEISTNTPIIKNAYIILLPDTKNGREKEEINKNLNITLVVPNTLFVLPMTWLGMWLKM
jgi:hypothetical protein